MITGARHMVVAGHYLAAEAGHAILQAGGNAVDAGVAAMIALGVLHSDQVQFSGVAPMVIYLAERDEVITIAGLGGWPQAARLDVLVRASTAARSRSDSSARSCRPRPTRGSCCARALRHPELRRRRGRRPSVTRATASPCTR